MVNSIDDAYAYVRRNVELFFRSGQPSALECATALANDAILLGSTEVHLARVDDWWLVSANQDWLVQGDHAVEALFQRMWPFKEAGVNSIRSEVLIGAFAAKIVLLTPSTRVVLRGDVRDGEGLETRLAPYAWRRAVAYRMND
jgi:hypothetical protein